MTVAIAHQASSASRTAALQAAAREAQLRRAELVVLHVVESLDLDVEAAYRQGLGTEIESALASVGAEDVAWTLRLSTEDDNVARTVLALAEQAGADLLVIGARRRSPVGKFLLGSVTQTLILEAGMPVLVVKPSL